MSGAPSIMGRLRKNVAFLRAINIARTKGGGPRIIKSARRQEVNNRNHSSESTSQHLLSLKKKPPSLASDNRRWKSVLRTSGGMLRNVSCMCAAVTLFSY